MKKYLFPILYLASVTHSLAESQFGIKIAPGLSYNRVYTNPDTANFAPDGAAPRLKIGIIYDLPFKDNHCFFSSGLSFATKQASIRNDSLKIQDQYELQYLHLPLLLKLYTGEVMLDTKLYVELGAVAMVKISDRVRKLKNQACIQNFRPFGISGLFGFGITYNISLFTSIFIGVSYQRGVFSMADKQCPMDNVPPIKIDAKAE